jgi:hypothetical protein
LSLHEGLPDTIQGWTFKVFLIKNSLGLLETKQAVDDRPSTAIPTTQRELGIATRPGERESAKKGAKRIKKGRKKGETIKTIAHMTDGE